MESTAIREFSEETGGATFKMRDLKQVAVIEFHKGREQVFECTVFFLYWWHGELKETSEMGEGHPFLMTNLPLDMMMAGDKEWLPLICNPHRNKVLRAKVFYSEDMTQVLDFKSEEL